MLPPRYEAFANSRFVADVPKSFAPTEPPGCGSMVGRGGGVGWRGRANVTRPGHPRRREPWATLFLGLRLRRRLLGFGVVSFRACLRTTFLFFLLFFRL